MKLNWGGWLVWGDQGFYQINKKIELKLLLSLFILRRIGHTFIDSLVALHPPICSLWQHLKGMNSWPQKHTRTGVFFHNLLVWIYGDRGNLTSIFCFQSLLMSCQHLFCLFWQFHNFKSEIKATVRIFPAALKGKKVFLPFCHICHCLTNITCSGLTSQKP